MTVARFDLTQDFVTHTPYEGLRAGAAPDAGNVALSITSLAPAPVFIKYDVQGLNASGTPVWSHADTIGVRLAPNQTLSVGADLDLDAAPRNGRCDDVLLQAADYVP